MDRFTHRFVGSSSHRDEDSPVRSIRLLVWTAATVRKGFFLTEARSLSIVENSPFVWIVGWMNQSMDAIDAKGLSILP